VGGTSRSYSAQRICPVTQWQGDVLHLQQFTGRSDGPGGNPESHQVPECQEGEGATGKVVQRAKYSGYASARPRYPSTAEISWKPNARNGSGGIQLALPNKPVTSGTFLLFAKSANSSPNSVPFTTPPPLQPADTNKPGCTSPQMGPPLMVNPIAPPHTCLNSGSFER